jgi:hypothetical protein
MQPGIFPIMRSARPAAALLAVLAAMALVACGDDDTDESTTSTATSGGAGSDVVFPSNCTSGATAEPASVVVTCADSGITVSELEWRSWGEETASGTGLAHVNDCDPDCVAGEITTYEDAQLTLSRVKDCDSARQYTRLELSYAGKAPPDASQRSRQRFPCP